MLPDCEMIASGPAVTASFSSTALTDSAHDGWLLPYAPFVLPPLKTVAAFTEMVSSRGTVEGDEDVLGDGVAFAGVAKYPARVKCALLGWLAFKAALAEARPTTEVAQASHRKDLEEKK